MKSTKHDDTRLLDNLRQGEAVEVSFFIDSREGKTAGQWFTSARGVKIEKLAGTGGGEVDLVKEGASEPEPTEADADLPF